MNPIADEARAAPQGPDLESVLAGALSSVSEAFKHPQLSCDPSVGGERPRLFEAVDELRRDVLTNVHAVLPHLAGSEQRRVTEGVAQLAERLVGVLLLTGSGPTASQLIGETLGCLPPGSYLDELTAASRDPDAYAQLTRARWFWLQGYAGKARRLAERVQRKTKEPSLEAAARRVIFDPQPIKSAPPLFTVNGFGLKLYGRGDRRRDGFYASTLYVCALFIPLLPITRYLVRDAGEGGWHFLGKLPLSAPARWYRRLLVLGIAGLIGWGQVGSWLESPRRLAGKDVEQAQQKVAGLPPEKALVEWERVVNLWGASTAGEVLAPAVEAWAALKLQVQVKEPFTPAQVPALERTVLRFLSMSAGARSASADAAVSAKLVEYAQQLGSSGRAELDARLKVLELAAKLSPSAAAAELTTTRHLLASLVAETWPLRAVEHYSQGGAKDLDGLTRAAALLDALEGAGTLFAEEAAVVRRWQLAARSEPSLAGAFERSEQRLAEATALLAAAGRAELLAARDEKQLAAAIEQRPGDQGLTVALARLLRERGDLSGATRRLERLGAPGRMNRARHAESRISAAHRKRVMGAQYAVGNRERKALVRRALQVTLELVDVSTRGVRRPPAGGDR